MTISLSRVPLRASFRAPLVLRQCCTRGNTARNMSRKSDQLPSEGESRRSDMSKWLTTKMDRIQNYIFTAGQTLNDFTGYSSIENIKKSIESKEEEIKQCRLEVRQAKEAYSDAINRRSNSQKEVNELLQRKQNWTPEDLQRFTDLYRNDHANQMAEQEAEARLNSKDKEFEDIRAEIAKLISERYHEEQIWSDKIRRASTYGTWGLMGFNILLFIVVQLGLEPWKRRRLVGSFEEKVKDALEKSRMEEQGMLEDLENEIERSRELTSKNNITIASGATSTGGELSLRSFPSRVATGIEQSTTIITSPKELFSTAIAGALLGALVTLAFRTGS